MDIHRLTTDQDPARYDSWIRNHPRGSLWQSLEWKRYQETLGRQTRLYVGENDGQIQLSALVVIDRTVAGLSTWEIARGPVGLDSDEEAVVKLMDKITHDAQRDRCLSLSVSPSSELPALRYPLEPSHRHQQPEATILLNLNLSDDQLLAQMHEKGRYNIRLAERKGVTVEQSADTHAFFQLVKRTAARDGFTHPSERTYEAFRKNLPDAFLLLAFGPEQAEPIAGLLGTTWNGTGIYYYGASDHQFRALQAPSLLQWHAMQLCRNLGCHTYDLFGIAPTVTRIQGSATGNDGQATSDPHHPWASVTDFKRKFGGTVVTYPPEQEILLRPVTKKLLDLKRRIIG